MRRRDPDAEAVDESFWGRARRRLDFPLTGSFVVDGLVLVVILMVIAALVGSIGLVASMPITTALAALVVSRMSGRQLESADAHAHAH